MKEFDVTNNRPKVLLLGNGIMKSYGNASWEDFLKSVKKDSVNVECYKDIPYTIQASAISAVKDSVRREKYEEAFNEYKYRQYAMLNKLLELPFDAILTTNYTYEIEYQLNNNYPQLSDKTKRKYSNAHHTDSNFLIYTHNHIENREIWHIHGEARRKSSIVATHDEYARHISKILGYLKNVGKKYEKNMDKLNFESWIDYFIMGDVYVLGQGFNFCEFDLWWLLSRRMRENAEVGTIRFYNPIIKDDKDSKDKQLALEAFDVTCENCEYTVLLKEDKEENNQQYREFYAKAINHISDNLKSR